ncbi:mitochondrial-processing peptidase subunit alpha [Trichomonascus vanleenenianus]|uniref:mitochondrial-processing protease subunit alpha n=1 Tax=Trichomonascus vanleenenianus TaxID=2268995 RepID=UPI003ECAF646
MLSRQLAKAAKRGLATATSNGRADFKLTTLSNGVRVATDPLPGYFASMGLFVDAGSRYESDRLSGCSHLVDRLAFKSTTTRSSNQMAEDLESLGGNYACTSSRESMMYQASVFNSDVEGMFAALVDTVRNPLITESEVERMKETVGYEIGEIWQRSDLILPELAHVAAFQGGIGNPLLCPEDRLPFLTKELVEEYRAKLYRPDRIVAAFISVDHARAVELAEKYLGDMKPANPAEIVEKPESVYTGGELTIPQPPPIGNLPQFSQLYVAFEGLSITDPDVYALATLQTLLGGGGSFSAGGPGKGMYSRLYTHVLNQFGYIESCQSFNHPYSDTGLFGISSSCIPQAAPYLAEVVCQQFYLAMGKGRGALTYDEVSRAKNQLKSSLLMNLESKLVELEDLGRQIQTYNTKIPVTEMCERIEALSVEDIRRVAERVFTGQSSKDGSGRATIVMQGQRDTFGDVDAVFKKYGIGSQSQKRKWF